MKRESKSASNRIVAILFGMVLVTAGCADVRLPQWMTGEPDETITSAPRPVMRRQSNAPKVAPNLGDVPDSKPSFSSQDDRQGELEDLTFERMQSLADKERLLRVDLSEAAVNPSADQEAGTTLAPMKPFSALRP